MSLSRQQRRALERAQLKQARRQAAPQASPVPLPPSTGPRTPEGKAVSSQNAMTHGLTAAAVVLPWENFQLTAEHQPQTITESIYVREMADQWWRLQRARNQEHAALCRLAQLAENPDLEQHGSLEKQLQLVTRYATRHELAFHRCFNMLRTLQKERRARELEEAEEVAELADQEVTLAATAPQLVSQNNRPVAAPQQFVSQNAAHPPTTPVPALAQTA